MGYKKQWFLMLTAYLKNFVFKAEHLYPVKLESLKVAPRHWIF